MIDPKFSQLTEDKESEPGELPEADRPEHCKCPEPLNPTDYTIELHDGGFTINHTVCNKQPWFMYDDWNLDLYMKPTPITVKIAPPCTQYHYDQIGCDCGPEISLSMEGPK